MKLPVFRNPVAFAAASVALLITAGCNQPAAETAKSSSPKEADIQQQQLCEVSEWQRDVVAAACKPGQKVVFLPRNWGNAQLPVIFAAVNCDVRYAIALTEGAVMCVYRPIQSEASTPANAASQPASRP
ncbi:MAG: hypothetical protein ACK4OE_10240 [Acidovorax sp.]|uniref:hypothetical protein n=1 Tax=Acidovorax sp. TaxID=1872122 RepID=UPI00391ACF0A